MTPDALNPEWCRQEAARIRESGVQWRNGYPVVPKIDTDRRDTRGWLAYIETLSQKEKTRCANSQPSR